MGGGEWRGEGAGEGRGLGGGVGEECCCWGVMDGKSLRGCEMPELTNGLCTYRGHDSTNIVPRLSMLYADDMVLRVEECFDPPKGYVNGLSSGCGWYQCFFSLNRLCYLTPIHSPPSSRTQIITAQSIPRPTELQRIPGTRERAIALSGIHAPRVELVPAVALASVLHAPVRIPVTLARAHLERHGRVVVVRCRVERADVGRFCHASVVGVVSDVGFYGGSGLRGC